MKYREGSMCCATVTESSPKQCLRLGHWGIEEHWLNEDGQPVA